jgi:hypothetical protein
MRQPTVGQRSRLIIGSLEQYTDAFLPILNTHISKILILLPLTFQIYVSDSFH